jgi:hypothetical protein
MATMTDPEFTAAQQLAMIKAEVFRLTHEEQAQVDFLAGSLRKSIGQLPLLAVAIALVSAEILDKDEAAGSGTQ